jgi:hypothetical protein
LKDKSDILWGMYQEHTTQGRHHEVQRASMTNIIIVVAGGVLALIAQGGVARDEWILVLFLPSYLGESTILVPLKRLVDLKGALSPGSSPV